jgi:tetrapyrrole methylase family protein/MazG family protein
MEDLKLKKNALKLEKLVELIETLRSDNGCPWDKKQTPQSMTVYLMEEVYELVDAIVSDNLEGVREELGDVLFQILFVACLFQDAGHFDLGDVVRCNIKKMMGRHPHVFGQERVATETDIRRNWHRIKRDENKSRQLSHLDSIPPNMPALMRAYRISERVAQTGFDWDSISDVMQKASEEWAELQEKLAVNDHSTQAMDQISMEFGDLLFALVNVARFARIHPETALAYATRKFEQRFRYMENTLADQEQGIETLSAEEMDILWEKAKKHENAKWPFS